MTDVSTCKSCGARIYWLRHERTGNLAPIDVDVSFKGNIAVNLEAGTYTIHEGGSRRNHFATCEAAAKWRGKRGA